MSHDQPEDRLPIARPLHDRADQGPPPTLTRTHGTRLVRWSSPSGIHVGELDGHRLTEVDPADLDPGVHAALGHPSRPHEPDGNSSLDEVELLAPIRPGKIIAVGLNYRDHAEETGAEIPQRPLIFAKYPSAVIGPYAHIHLTEETTQLDYEGELGVVIGRTARHVPVEHALHHVTGYVACNDVSARDAQFSDGQWVRGKSFDTFAPLGPALALPHDRLDPGDIDVRTWVNGELRQSSNTRRLIFGVADLVAYASRYFTLDAGDLILTGTPGGVGMGMVPPRYLQVGDVVRVEVGGVGLIQNQVVQAPTASTGR